MLLDSLHTFLLPFLFLTGLVAGIIDAIAGGGGLICLPVLLGIGVPPHIALGTNKFQGTLGTLAATWRYHRLGWISLRTAAPGLFFSGIGAGLGAIASQFLSTAVLNKVTPLLLFIILIYSVFIPKKWAEDTSPKLTAFIFYFIFGLLLGFYDGFFGPGAGSFWVFSLTFFLGYNLTKAMAYTKILNFNTNVTALLFFAIGGQVDYRIGLFMAVGQLIGGVIGAQLAITRGADFIQPIFLLVVSGTITTLFYKNFLSEQSTFIKIFFILSILLSMVLFYLFKIGRKKRAVLKNQLPYR